MRRDRARAIRGFYQPATNLTRRRRCPVMPAVAGIQTFARRNKGMDGGSPLAPRLKLAACGLRQEKTGQTFPGRSSGCLVADRDRLITNS
jgi:hypothetical protein